MNITYLKIIITYNTADIFGNVLYQKQLYFVKFHC